MIKKIEEFKPNGYNPSLGVYASNYIFTGDWEDELAALDYTPRTTVYGNSQIDESDAIKGIQTGYLYNSFSSWDGKSTSHESPNLITEEEKPDQYKWTDSYYNSPKIAAILDWFQLPMTRVRVFQQNPGHKMIMHTDFDNQKGTESGETIRIFVQLNEMPGGAWFHFRTGDSQISINLRKGQFLVFHPDHTGHGTENLTDIPRNTFMIVAKRNDWLDSLADDYTMKFIDVNDLVKNKEVMAA